MYNYLSQFEELPIGSSPYAEECVQVDSKVDYLPAMKIELQRFKNFLEKKFPILENHNICFVIIWNQHEFGPYGEVAVRYVADDPIGEEFALKVEAECPEYWVDKPSKNFLKLIESERQLLLK